MCMSLSIFYVHIYICIYIYAIYLSSWDQAARTDVDASPSDLKNYICLSPCICMYRSCIHIYAIYIRVYTLYIYIFFFFFKIVAPKE